MESTTIKDASTTVLEMMSGTEIQVPNYQRAYSWITPIKGNDRKSQNDVFLNDLEKHDKTSGKNTRYYFGHFLFEKRDNIHYVIDGQQRLTTIVIFISVIFAQLTKLRTLNENEMKIYGVFVKSSARCPFATVSYDDRFFKDYVIDQSIKNKSNLETESAKRIAQAFDYFEEKLALKGDDYLVRMLNLVSNAVCTTHLVNNEIEAIQMFIFQNDRGKEPTNLEKVKALFMFAVHQYGSDAEIKSLSDEIKDRFEKIYKSISAIEHKIDEDTILLYTQRVFFNSLAENNALKKIEEELYGSNCNPIEFVKKFCLCLSKNFEYIQRFFGNDERENFEIHSLITTNSTSIAIPFIIKAYSFNIEMSLIKILCVHLENLVLRQLVTGTRADVIQRVNDVFQAFSSENPSIEPIVNRINMLKTTTDWWWNYWNNENLLISLQGHIYPQLAKYLLWKYEVYLESLGKSGYESTRFDKIKNPHLEHIAPKTEPEIKSHGYDKYTEEFKNTYMECLGNYLLLSESHNCSVGNISFLAKIQTYNHNEQQREVKELGTSANNKWTRQLIEERKKKIISVIMEC